MKGAKPTAGFLDALAALRDGLADAGGPAAFIGGVAVIARGIARYTADIDATVLASGTNIDVLLRTLLHHKIGPRIKDAAGFARANQVLLLQHGPSGVPLDVSLAWLPFEEQAIRGARQCVFAGVRIRVVTATDLAIYKLIAHRPRDLDDVERLLALHGPRVDLNRVRGVLESLAEALEGPDRLATLASFRRRVLSGEVSPRKAARGRKQAGRKPR